MTSDMEETLLELAGDMMEEFLDFSFYADVKRVVNPAKVTDHHAILPTKPAMKAEWTGLSEKKRSLLYLTSMQVLKAVCLGLFIFLLLVMLAAYPIAARYRLTWVECLQKALIVTGLYFPWFFVMGTFLLLVAMVFVTSVLSFLLGLMVFFLIGFSSLTFLQVGLMEKIFARFKE